MLTVTGSYDDVNMQANTPEEIHEQLREIAMEAWERIRPSGENYGSWAKIMQKPNESYVDFLSQLKITIERTVIGEQARQRLLRLLAYENANEDCRRAILPIKETGDMNAYMKVCKDIGSESRRMQIFAETMATTWHALQASPKGSNVKCFGCGKTGHLKRDCRAGKSGDRKSPGTCPRCKKGKHWARECRTKPQNNTAPQTLPLPGNYPAGQLRGPRSMTVASQLSSPSNPPQSIVQPWMFQQ